MCDAIAGSVAHEQALKPRGHSPNGQPGQFPDGTDSHHRQGFTEQGDPW